MTALERLRGVMPAWSADPAPEVLIRSRGGLAPRRSYPVAQNDRFVPRTTSVGEDLVLENIGEGNDILTEGEEEGVLDRAKRLKNVGGGAAVLVEQEVGDEENKLRSIRARPGAGVTVEEQDEDIMVATVGAGGSANFNIDGNITVDQGLVTAIFEGERGKTGALKILRCGSTVPETILEWENGQMKTEGDVVLEVGECNDGGSGGGSFF